MLADLPLYISNSFNSLTSSSTNKQNDISQYQNSYYKVIDSFLTPQECKELITLAESESDWIPAALCNNINHIIIKRRHSERILRFDSTTSDKLFERLLPHLKDIKVLRPGQEFARYILNRGHNPTYKLVGLNERLSFLRYGSGNYFCRHCDGLLQLPDDRRSFLTVQIYLGKEDVKTRFWSSDGKEYCDVEPEPGRVLIFQQRNLLHSGEDVAKGVKYAVRSDLTFMKL